MMMRVRMEVRVGWSWWAWYCGGWETEMMVLGGKVDVVCLLVGGIGDGFWKGGLGVSS